MRTDAVAAVSFANYGARRSAATATLARCVEDSGLPAPRTLEAIRICGGRKSGVHALSPQGGGRPTMGEAAAPRQGMAQDFPPGCAGLDPGGALPPRNLEGRRTNGCPANHAGSLGGSPFCVSFLSFLV